jgi:hypothetical protein
MVANDRRASTVELLDTRARIAWTRGGETLTFNVRDLLTSETLGLGLRLDIHRLTQTSSAVGPPMVATFDEFQLKSRHAD